MKPSFDLKYSAHTSECQQTPLHTGILFFSDFSFLYRVCWRLGFYSLRVPFVRTSDLLLINDYLAKRHPDLCMQWFPPIFTKVCATVLFSLKTFCRLCFNFLRSGWPEYELFFKCWYYLSLFWYVFKMCIFLFRLPHSLNWGSCPAVVIGHAESANFAAWLVTDTVARLGIVNNGKKLPVWQFCLWSPYLNLQETVLSWYVLISP